MPRGPPARRLASTSASVSAPAPFTPPSPRAAEAQAPHSDPDLLSLTDDEFLAAAVQAAWPSGPPADTKPFSYPTASTPSTSGTPPSQGYGAPVSHLRAMRMVPLGAGPDSGFGLGGLPVAQGQLPSASAGGLSEEELSKAMVKILGQVYKPAVRCDDSQGRSRCTLERMERESH